MKTITPEHIQEVLHYADEFPHSGQNRELAEIVRHLLAPSAPLVAVGDIKNPLPKGWHLIKKTTCYALVDGEICVANLVGPAAEQHASMIANVLAGQVAPQSFEKFEQLNSGQVAPQATVEEMREIIKDALSGFSCTQVAAHYPADHWSQRATALLASAATLATVEPLTEIRKLASRLQNSAYSHGCIDSKDYPSDKKYIDAADKSDAALKTLIDACALLATPPTSKAAPAVISRELLGKIVDEAFGGACEDTSPIEDIYRIIVREFGMPTSKATEDSEEDAFIIKQLATLLADIAITLKGPELALHRHSYHDLPELAQKMKLELDLHRMQEATSKTDTGAVRNTALEEAAKSIDQIDDSYAPEYRACQEHIRALKSATPFTIKEEPTGEQL